VHLPESIVYGITLIGNGPTHPYKHYSAVTDRVIGAINCIGQAQLVLTYSSYFYPSPLSQRRRNPNA